MAADDEPANGRRPDHPRKTEIECACDEWPAARVDEHRANQQERTDRVAGKYDPVPVDVLGQLSLIDQVASQQADQIGAESAVRFLVDQVDVIVVAELEEKV